MASRFHMKDFSGNNSSSSSWDATPANGTTEYDTNTNGNTNGNTTGEEYVYFESSTKPHNMMVVGVLIGLIILLCIILTFVTMPPFLAWMRRKMPVSQRRIDRRYATIEGWLISKVSCFELSVLMNHETKFVVLYTHSARCICLFF
jgi:hypothetical protein